MNRILDCDRVCEELERQALKRWWVAEQAGIHETTFRRWLSGKTRKIRVDNLYRLAGVLGVDPEAIASN